MKFVPKLSVDERLNLSILRKLLLSHVSMNRIVTQNAANPIGLAKILGQLLEENENE